VDYRRGGRLNFNTAVTKTPGRVVSRVVRGTVQASIRTHCPQPASEPALGVVGVGVECREACQGLQCLPYLID
jgi:hypothetical protein